MSKSTFCDTLKMCCQDEEMIIEVHNNEENNTEPIVLSDDDIWHCLLRLVRQRRICHRTNSRE